MLLLQKWNFQTHTYEPFESPAIVLKIYSEDMDERCDCANCGKIMTYGDGYTSKTIHTEGGFGYPVCSECYEKEVEEDRKYR